MECREFYNWDKNFDSLSEEQTIELLGHACICDYHNCLVTAYENSFDSQLDVAFRLEPVTQPEPWFSVQLWGWVRNMEILKIPDGIAGMQIWVARAIQFVVLAVIFNVVVTIAFGAVNLVFQLIEVLNSKQQISQTEPINEQITKETLKSSATSQLANNIGGKLDIAASGLPAPSPTPLPAAVSPTPTPTPAGKVVISYATGPENTSDKKVENANDDNNGGRNETEKTDVKDKSSTSPENLQSQLNQNIQPIKMDTEIGRVDARLTKVNNLILENGTAHLSYQACGDCNKLVQNWLKNKIPLLKGSTVVNIQLTSNSGFEADQVATKINFEGETFVTKYFVRQKNGVYIFSLPNGFGAQILVDNAVKLTIEPTSQKLNSFTISLD